MAAAGGGSARSWRISGGGRTAKVATSPCIRHVAHSDLWRISGHLGFYNESMYKPIAVDDEEYSSSR